MINRNSKANSAPSGSGPGLGAPGIDRSPASTTKPRPNALRQAPLKPHRINIIRRWIFAYFLLLLFEGALRKWIFAGVPLISLPLSVVRDPIAVIIYFLAGRAHVLSGRIRHLCWVGLGVFLALGVFQVLSTPGLSFWVVLYGLHSYWLHVPLIFVMAAVLRQDDLLRIGRWLLLLAAPMAVLMVAQFLSPPDGILNRGMFAEGEGQIAAALGRVRPAGTFSYNSGVASFNLLATAYLIFSFVDGRWISSWTKWIAAVALVAILPVSGSRGFVLSFGLLLAFALIGGNFSARLLRVTIRTVAIGAAIFALLTFTSFFQQGLETFTARWNEALGASSTGTVNEAIFLRVFSDFAGAFTASGKSPLLGYGIGLGSNFGAAFTYGGLFFALAESEWERTVLEMGPIVGILWLVLRCGFGGFLIRKSWALLKRGQSLAWLLFGTECLSFFNGSLAQPSSLGFIIFTTGLCLAAVKSAERGDVLPARATKKTVRRNALPSFRATRRP